MTELGLRIRLFASIVAASAMLSLVSGTAALAQAPVCSVWLIESSRFMNVPFGAFMPDRAFVPGSDKPTQNIPTVDLPVNIGVIKCGTELILYDTGWKQQDYLKMTGTIFQSILRQGRSRKTRAMRARSMPYTRSRHTRKCGAPPSRRAICCSDPTPSTLRAGSASVCSLSSSARCSRGFWCARAWPGRVTHDDESRNPVAVTPTPVGDQRRARARRAERRRYATGAVGDAGGALR